MLAAAAIVVLCLAGYGGYRVWRRLTAAAVDPMMPVCSSQPQNSGRSHARGGIVAHGDT